ncbi:hypothetical protein [Streptomyces agglomeratus]|uniref:hypothetical protein n=1 Tax=Streptomyces agglomeratus TaxID=285458 RepID=UPI0030B8E0EA
MWVGKRGTVGRIGGDEFAALTRPVPATGPCAWSTSRTRSPSRSRTTASSSPSPYPPDPLPRTRSAPTTWPC